MSASAVDVCLILEGTYPYIRGGVSQWVQQLVTGLPHLHFAIIHLRFGPPPPRSIYERPPNVLQFLTVPVEEFHDARPESRWWSEHLTLPKAQVYHALSTGFAGVLGMQIKHATGRPLLLTEHGIYWHEVASGSDDLECGFRVVGDSGSWLGLTANREHWTETLRDLARQTYEAADAILTVCQANQALQLDNCARAERCRVISNGVAVPPTSRLTSRSPTPPHFGLVGRVVPIKDVHTFLRAAARVRAELPTARFSVIGPLDHDRAYAAECRSLAASLELPAGIFVGETDPFEYYCGLTALVLTSVSEGLPYAVLEAMSCGLAVIATDVGGCRDLIEGGDGLGAAGLLTPVRDPDATAQAMITLAGDNGLRERLGGAGCERVARHYTLSRFIAAYGGLYNEFLRPPATPDRSCRT